MRDVHLNVAGKAEEQTAVMKTDRRLRALTSMFALCLPLCAASLQKREDARIFDTQFAVLESGAGDESGTENVARGGEKPGRVAGQQPERFPIATALLPDQAADADWIPAPGDPEALAQFIARNHRMRQPAETHEELVRASLPSRQLELMIVIGILLLMVGGSLAWLVRDAAEPYTRPDRRLDRRESLCVPTLVFSTHAGSSSLSSLASSVARATPRRGPGSAATDLRSRAAAVGGR